MVRYFWRVVFLGYVLDKSHREDAECSREVVNEWKVVGNTRSLVNARVLHEAMLVPVNSVW